LGVDRLRYFMGRAMRDYLGMAAALLAFWLAVSFVFSWGL
jgi:hypothetical protein